MLSIGIDIGGTKVAAGVVGEDGEILRRLQLPTPSKSPEAVEDAIVQVVEELGRTHDIGAVGIGAAGWVDTDRPSCASLPTSPGATSRSRHA